MQKVESYKSEDGELHSSFVRALAADLHFFLPKSGSDSNSKILDWVDCLRIIENADLIAVILRQYYSEMGLPMPEEAKVIKDKKRLECHADIPF